MGMLFLQKGILLTLLLDCSFCLFKLLFGWYVNQKNMYMQINIWKKWKVFLHSSSSLFFSNPKELTTFFFVVNRKASNFDKNMKELLLRFYNETVFPLLWRCHAERHSFKTFMNYLLYPKNHKKLPSIT